MTLELDPQRKEVSLAGRYWTNEVREPRVGVMLHYDGSSSDEGGLSWLLSADARAGYNLLVLRDGTWARLAPLDARAWHGGECQPSSSAPEYKDANSAFYGLTIAAAPGERAGAAQVLTVAWLCARLFARHEWPLTDGRRIVGHSSEAWPRGRKIDPEGPDPRAPILSVPEVRRLVRDFLNPTPLL